jgi:ABC-type transporter Mla MlaB component
MTSGRPVYDDGVLRITSTSHPPGLALEGEIDESTYPGLVQALQASSNGRAEIHLSLGGVSYCDLAGLRAIVCTTGADDCEPDAAGDQGPGDGRRVVLHEVPAQLMTVLQIVGWDSTPGLALDPPAAGPAPAPDRLPKGGWQGSAVS